jgi:uncharacterized protein (DUF4415 family)
VEFDWDAGNLGHIARHGVDPWETDEAVLDPNRVPFPAHSGPTGVRGGDEKTQDEPLRDPAEIPEFSSEEDARAFWDTHEVTEEYLERAGPLPPEALPPAEPGSRSVSVRLDRDVLRRLRALARKKGKGVQALLREFLVERLYLVG